KSNAYVIFDYRGPDNFKFAGVDAGLDKVQIGERTPSGWNVLVQVNLQLEPNTDYHLRVVINGSTANIEVDGASALGYAFASLLNLGRIGIGTSNAVSRFDNVSLLVL